MSNYFSRKKLLQTPSRRAAYSDRTSYVMAEMSRLAYYKFEGGNNVEELLAGIEALVPEDTDMSVFESLVRSTVPASDAEKGKTILARILQENGYKLIAPFSDEDSGAQAFLCIHEESSSAVLAFRGTEASLKDIKTDVKARLETVETGKGTVQIHAGYLEQFQSLKTRISDKLGSSEVRNRQLFITGHSLGGALAITATKFLASDSTGACYTFGSPPVGTRDFDRDIKTPIYRIVNHVDIVPRLPNPILVHGVRGVAILLGLVLAPFTGLSSSIRNSNWYRSLQETLLDAQKYRQSGYGSYLVGDGQKARLRYNVGTYDRFIWWLKQFRNLFRGEIDLVSDHSIDEYSRKLAIWATRRK